MVSFLPYYSQTYFLNKLSRFNGLLPSAFPSNTVSLHQLLTITASETGLLQRVNRTECDLVQTVVRAPRGDGTEGLAILFLVDMEQPTAATIGSATVNHFSKHAEWLAKDLVVVFANTAACDPLESAEEWLRLYNTKTEIFFLENVGQIQQAIVVNIDNMSHRRHIDIRVTGRAGKLPNYDMVRLLTTVAWQYFRGVSVSLNGVQADQDYRNQLKTSIESIESLAIGDPNGAHGAFIENHIDAGTVTFAAVGLQDVVGFLEVAIRSANNLHEKFHHSTNLYVLMGPDIFATVAVYISVPISLLASLLAILQCRLASTPSTFVLDMYTWVVTVVVHSSMLIVAQVQSLRVEMLLVVLLALSFGGRIAHSMCFLGPEAKVQSQSAISSLSVVLLMASYLFVHNWALCCLLLFSTIPVGYGGLLTRKRSLLALALVPVLGLALWRKSAIMMISLSQVIAMYLCHTNVLNM